MLNRGDEVVRLLGGRIPMYLKVTALYEDRIVCGAWEFDRKTGIEIDEQFGWGPTTGKSGSVLAMKDGEPVVTMPGSIGPDMQTKDVAFSIEREHINLPPKPQN